MIQRILLTCAIAVAVVAAAADSTAAPVKYVLQTPGVV
jgi:hypothetical protein